MFILLFDHITLCIAEAFAHYIFNYVVAIMKMTYLNQMNRLRQRQQQQIHQLVQKHRDQSTELERQISYAAR